jgi:tRNA A-37 threonylcarbamoyl transferase component Bud32
MTDPAAPTSAMDRGEPAGRRKRRRPSGEPPALPRERGWTRWLWAMALVVGVGIALTIVYAVSDVLQGVDQDVLDWFAGHRSDALVDVAKVFNGLYLTWVVLAVRVLAVVVMALYRRWRHLVVFLATFVITDWVVLRLGVDLPVPSVPVLAGRDTYQFPSRTMTALAITVFSLVFALVPAGSARRRARQAVVLLLVLVGLAELELAGDYPIPMLYAMVLSAAVAYAAFKGAAPDEAFPVSYRRGGSAAHLDLSGPREEAIVRGVSQQLGLEVTEVKPFGLAGSGGSSPLRMTLADGRHLFGKIYATSHVRSDRWYRVGRTILYGTLEDETPFGSVRRLTEYEDYALRLLDDVGIQVARTQGIVELTPDAEYMLVTEFFEGAKNLGDVEIDDTVIDEGLDLVRRLWDEGLAHRDIKPANLLVKDGHLQLVDVSALEVRPTPWRQAVDLANMMLTLALQSDPDRVYERAVLRFTPDEIAEAFASAVGLAIPTQLQTRLKTDRRPLMARFKELAPARDPVSIQRWSTNRIITTAVVVGGALFLATLLGDSIRAGLN